MIVIGIDPSLTATGMAYADGSTLTVKPDVVGDERLVQIQDAVFLALEAAGRCDLVVLEDLPTHAHGAGKTGMAQGAIRLTLYIHAQQYVTVTAATLKKFATGKGNATKPDMRVELYKRTGLDLRDDNQVDAWWLRALGHHLLDDPLVELPKSHLDALAKVAPLPTGMAV